VINGRRQQQVQPRLAAGTHIAILLVMALMIAIYIPLRYRGLWSIGGDTSLFTKVIRPILSSGDLVPRGSELYPNGYGFQALTVFLVKLSGVELAYWQLYGATLLIVWLVLPAWLLYREWTASNEAATLATILLFLQPELLFGIMRGTHEKFTRGLIMLGLFLFVRSLRPGLTQGRLVPLVLAFYLVAFAQLSFNTLFASMSIWAMVLAAALIWAITAYLGQLPRWRPMLRRMLFVVLIWFVLNTIYTFHAYAPAQRSLQIFQSVGDQIASLFVKAEETTAINPYTSWVIDAWVSLPIYFVVSQANWILLFGSAGIWVRQTVGWLRRRTGPSDERELLLWAFYGAFGCLGGIAVLTDISGALSSNLQHRLFPSIIMVAAPAAAAWLVALRPRPTWHWRLARGLLWAGVGLIGILSLLKATNEPLVSNRWQFYLPAELRAVDWAEQALVDRVLWTGIDGRLVETLNTRVEPVSPSLRIDRFYADPNTHDFMISDITRSQSARLRIPIPVEADDHVTYDNGQVQILHRRPETPYQR
jgi:hypothetical protein